MPAASKHTHVSIPKSDYFSLVQKSRGLENVHILLHQKELEAKNSNERCKNFKRYLLSTHSLLSKRTKEINNLIALLKKKVCSNCGSLQFEDKDSDLEFFSSIESLSSFADGSEPSLKEDSNGQKNVLAQEAAGSIRTVCRDDQLEMDCAPADLSNIRTKTHFPSTVNLKNKTESSIWKGTDFDDSGICATNSERGKLYKQEEYDVSIKLSNRIPPEDLTESFCPPLGVSERYFNNVVSELSRTKLWLHDLLKKNDTDLSTFMDAKKAQTQISRMKKDTDSILEELEKAKKENQCLRGFLLAMVEKSKESDTANVHNKEESGIDAVSFTSDHTYTKDELHVVHTSSGESVHTSTNTVSHEKMQDGTSSLNSENCSQAVSNPEEKKKLVDETSADSVADRLSLQNLDSSTTEPVMLWQQKLLVEKAKVKDLNAHLTRVREECHYLQVQNEMLATQYNDLLQTMEEIGRESPQLIKQENEKLECEVYRLKKLLKKIHEDHEIVLSTIPPLQETLDAEEQRNIKLEAKLAEEKNSHASTKTELLKMYSDLRNKMNLVLYENAQFRKAALPQTTTASMLSDLKPRRDMPLSGYTETHHTKLGTASSHSTENSRRSKVTDYSSQSDSASTFEKIDHEDFFEQDVPNVNDSHLVKKSSTESDVYQCERCYLDFTSYDKYQSHTQKCLD